MRTPTLNKLVDMVFITCLGFTAAPAMADSHDNHHMMQQDMMQAKEKLKEAEAAKGAERQKMMGEHMQMMHDMMGKMQAMKPMHMTMHKREEWMNQHQKLMDDMMSQMMQENNMMMEMGKMPMDTRDMHKH